MSRVATTSVLRFSHLLIYQHKAINTETEIGKQIHTHTPATVSFKYYKFFDCLVMLFIYLSLPIYGAYHKQDSSIYPEQTLTEIINWP